jgi:hypothetical protein
MDNVHQETVLAFSNQRPAVTLDKISETRKKQSYALWHQYPELWRV